MFSRNRNGEDLKWSKILLQPDVGMKNHLPLHNPQPPFAFAEAGGKVLLSSSQLLATLLVTFSLAGKMDKYRLVEEKVIGAPGFDRSSSADAKPSNASTMEDICVVRITPQAKPRSCITTAMNILVRVHRE